MKKVLIVAYYWPPAGGGGVQRWLKFVKVPENLWLGTHRLCAGACRLPAHG